MLALRAMRRTASPLRRTVAILGAAWLLVAYIVTTVQATAMICSEEAAPPVTSPATAPVTSPVTSMAPPCHGHAPAAPADEPAPASKACSPFCQLLCHGLALLAHPALTVPLVAAPDFSAEIAVRPLPLLPDTIDHVPL